jgi:hypothetical protein
VRFYLDEDISPAVVVALRRLGIDALDAHRAGNLGLSSEAQLAFAARQRRCLVTGNARDFVSLGRRAVLEGRPHAGLVLCPPGLRHGAPGVLARALAGLAARYPGGLGEYAVLFL